LVFCMWGGIIKYVTFLYMFLTSTCLAYCVDAVWVWFHEIPFLGVVPDVNRVSLFVFRVFVYLFSWGIGLLIWWWNPVISPRNMIGSLHKTIKRQDQEVYRKIELLVLLVIIAVFIVFPIVYTYYDF